MHIHAYRVGAILTILGPFTYFVSGTSSLSAFIPSIFGVLFIIIARLANNEKIRPHVMHFGLFVALVGILGLAPMLLENGDDFINLAKEAAKKGGSLDMKELVKLHGV